MARVAAKHFLLGLFHARFGVAAPAHRRSAMARQVRIACEELGPAFIKLGQLASVRPDLFSAEAVFELERLQDSVPPVDAALIHEVIRAEFGRDVVELFDEFEDVPVASASIAQVHRARLRDGYRPVIGEALPAGTRVAIKVVRPGARSDIEADVALARAWIRRVPKIGLLARVDLEAFLGEFEATLRSETDLRNEARVAERFAFDVRDDEIVLVPRVVWPRTTRRVLTMEFIDGWRLTELTDAERDGVDARALAVHGADVFMRQVLVLGRYHADLHPANLFVTPDSRICYLDFGIIGHTEPAQRIAIAQVLAATVYGDADRAVRYSRELGLVIPVEQETAVRNHVAALMERTLTRPGLRADVKGFAIGFLSMLADFKIPVPVGYGLLIKALVTVEGVAQAIYPDIDITQTARPFATRLIAQEMLRPARLYAKAPEMLQAALRVLSE